MRHVYILRRAMKRELWRRTMTAVASQSTNRREIQNFITTRHAQPADDKAIAALLLNSFLETNNKKMPEVRHNEQRIMELFDVKSRREAGIVIVVEIGREIIATCAMIAPGSSEGEEWTLETAYLRTVAVDPAFHGLGLSGALLGESLRIAEKWNVEHIALHVQRGAAGVARLYEQFGFKRDEEGDKESCGNMLEGWIYDLQC
jgi:GNAT superfamily N-acetyltransferase